jgi:hypothetical protein
MSSCDDSKNITTMNRGACALIVTSASPSSTRTSSASTLSGSGCRSGGGGGGGEESGRRGSGGRRVTVFTVAPQVLITAVSTASTATANLLEALQKKRTNKRSAPFDDVVMSAENHVAADDMSNMQARQQNRATQVEGKLKISFHIYSSIRDYETHNIYLAFGKVLARYFVMPYFMCA